MNTGILESQRELSLSDNFRITQHASQEMEDPKPTSRRLLLDEKAISSDPKLPAFLARPAGAPVYDGFPIIEETKTDGWYFGAITEFINADGCDSGDGFVVAPDGSRAGIVWDVGDHEMEVILPPDDKRWGVYAVWFPRVIRTVDDLVDGFRTILPELRLKFAEINGTRTA